MSSPPTTAADPAALHDAVDALLTRVRRAGRRSLYAAGAAWSQRWGYGHPDNHAADERCRLAALHHGLIELRHQTVTEAAGVVRAVLHLGELVPPYPVLRAVRDAATATAVAGLVAVEDADLLTAPLFSILDGGTSHARR